MANVMALTFQRAFKSVKLACLRCGQYRKMANSKFEYVKKYEANDNLLPNCWIVIRVDGKGFHKFADSHEFTKPNDSRSLNLMNRAAVGVMEQFFDVILAYGQSDEYSFVLKKDTDLYNRRASKIMSTVTSLFTSMYVYHWSSFFDQQRPKYPPTFDGRCVLYPSDEDLKDYLSWRQADLHINNLYNTTFWNLVQKSNKTPKEAEERLSGTMAADKNEILFSEFNINYNNEPIMFKKGTILLRKKIPNHGVDRKKNVIVDINDDMIQKRFWETHRELLEDDEPQEYNPPGELSSLVREQIKRRKLAKYNLDETHSNDKL